MIPPESRGATAALLGALVLAAVLVLLHIGAPASFDGVNTYLPLARRLLSEGFAFLQTPESVRVAPLAYIVPALLGASETVVRWGNVVLYLAAIVLAFDAARIAHSRAAGVAAAFLLALSPTIRPYVADVLTEPTFLLMIALWSAAVAHVSTARGSPARWIAAGAIALTLATLTRPAVMLFAPAMAVLFALRAWRGREASRAVDWRLAAMHALAVVVPLAWIVRNQVTFGLASIATGSGAALWLGIDPMVDGFDPVYYGLDYDVLAIARDMHHLSLEADRILRDAAAMQLHDLPLSVVAEMFARKAGAFLVVTSTELSQGLAGLRAWRVALIALAVFGLFWNWRSRWVVALVVLMLYMVVVHLPALYHHRYSVGALDVPLALLAALGIAECLRERRRMAMAAVAVTLAVGAGVAPLADAGPGAPHVERAPGQVLFSRTVAMIEGIGTENALPQEGPGQYVLAPGAALDIPIAFAPQYAGDYTAAIIGMKVTGLRGRPACNALRLRYREARQARFAPERTMRIPIRPDGQMRPVIAGTTHPLRLGPEGVLRLEFECAYPASLEMGTITVISPRRSVIYHQRLLERAREPR